MPVVQDDINYITKNLLCVLAEHGLLETGRKTLTTIITIVMRGGKVQAIILGSWQDGLCYHVPLDRVQAGPAD